MVFRFTSFDAVDVGALRLKHVDMVYRNVSTHLKYGVECNPSAGGGAGLSSEQDLDRRYQRVVAELLLFRTCDIALPAVAAVVPAATAAGALKHCLL